MEKKSYAYDGPVRDGWGNLLRDNWYGTTYATSDKKALNNLSYQYKRETGRTADSKVVLNPRYLEEE